MSPATRAPRAGDAVPPCLCVLLELSLAHRTIDPEDILALGAAHAGNWPAIVDACELAVDELEPCDANLRAHSALTEHVEKCRRAIHR